MRQLEPSERAAGYLGAVFVAGCCAGGLALVGALVSLFASNLIAMGICLIAAALAFGLLAIAILSR
jgi:hypothetical protein